MQRDIIIDVISSSYTVNDILSDMNQILSDLNQITIFSIYFNKTSQQKVSLLFPVGAKLFRADKNHGRITVYGVPSQLYGTCVRRKLDHSPL
jgi:hypothetical protein